MSPHDAAKHNGKTHNARVVEAFEALRFMGVSDHFWVMNSENAVYDDDGHDISNGHCVERLELLMNLAGNAYSIYHFVPVFLATLAVVGRYGILTESLEDSHAVHAPAVVGADGQSQDCRLPEE